MSAYVCNTYHLSILARAASAAEAHSGAQLCTGYDVQDAERLANVLYTENVRSVTRRGSASADKYSATIDFDRRALRGALEPIQVIKAAHCYTYQACETGDFERTEAAQIINRIIAVFLTRIPGYESAQWEMSPIAA